MTGHKAKELHKSPVAREKHECPVFFIGFFGSSWSFAEFRESRVRSLMTQVRPAEVEEVRVWGAGFRVYGLGFAV